MKYEYIQMTYTFDTSICWSARGATAVCDVFVADTVLYRPYLHSHASAPHVALPPICTQLIGPGHVLGEYRLHRHHPINTPYLLHSRLLIGVVFADQLPIGTAPSRGGDFALFHCPPGLSYHGPANPALV